MSSFGILTNSETDCNRSFGHCKDKSSLSNFMSNVIDIEIRYIVELSFSAQLSYGRCDFDLEGHRSRKSNIEHRPTDSQRDN